MNAYDFVHLSLYAMGGKIRGKTKLQKTVYFLGALTDHLKSLGYVAHYYGPYSSDVAEAVDRLRVLGFVEQSVATGGSVDSRGFEVARYDYSLNEEGKCVARRKAKRYEGAWRKLREAAETLKQAGELDYVKLSIAAKTYFMLDQKRGETSVADLTRLARRFGWSVGQEEVTAAAQFLQSIGLVRLKRQP